MRKYRVLAAAVLGVALTLTGCSSGSTEPDTTCDPIYVSSYKAATTADALDALVAATRLAAPGREVVILPHSQRHDADLLASDGGGGGAWRVADVPVFFTGTDVILTTTSLLPGRMPDCEPGQ